MRILLRKLSEIFMDLDKQTHFLESLNGEGKAINFKQKIYQILFTGIKQTFSHSVRLDELFPTVVTRANTSLFTYIFKIFIVATNFRIFQGYLMLSKKNVGQKGTKM